MNSTPATGTPLKILIVDDEVAIGSFLCEMLSAMGHDAESVATGAEALERLAATDYHIAIVDRGLLDMNGFHVIRQAKERTPQLIGIAVSGMLVESYEELEENRIDEHLEKPFSFEELRFVIGRYERFISALNAGPEPAPEAAEVNLLKMHFVEIAHQLKTPVSALKEFLSLLLLDGSNLSEKQSRYLHIADENVDRLLYLCSVLQNLARDEGNLWNIQIDSESPELILNRVLASWEPILAKRNLKLVVSMGGNLPQIKTDARAVDQILANLLDNAAKYAPQGGTVDVQCTMNGSELVLDVQNEGAVFSASDEEDIFKPFTRLDNSQQTDGLGLGLPIATALAKKIGGSLTLNHTPDKAASFRLTLPADRT